MIQKTFAASGTFDLGNVSDGRTGKWAIAINELAGADVSVQPKARLTGSGLDHANCAYTDMADGTPQTAAITADALIQIEASGLDVQLDVTVTSGDGVTIYATPLIG